MRINSIPPRDLYYQYVHVQTNQPTMARPTQGADKVELTGEAKSFTAALKAAKESLRAQEPSAARIDSLQAQVQSGAYEISGYDVAGRILGR